MFDRLLAYFLLSLIFNAFASTLLYAQPVEAYDAGDFFATVLGFAIAVVLFLAGMGWHARRQGVAY